MSKRHYPTPMTAPWRTSYAGQGLGANLPRSTPAPLPSFKGSHREPSAASVYSGRGICRVCRDDVLINRNELLRKHRS